MTPRERRLVAVAAALLVFTAIVRLVLLPYQAAREEIRREAAVQRTEIERQRTAQAALTLYRAQLSELRAESRAVVAYAAPTVEAAELQLLAAVGGRSSRARVVVESLGLVKVERSDQRSQPGAPRRAGRPRFVPVGVDLAGRAEAPALARLFADLRDGPGRHAVRAVTLRRNGRVFQFRLVIIAIADLGGERS